LLDTGLNHNFSIQEVHLIKWAGIPPAALPLLGSARESGRTVARRRAHFWIRGNQPGKRDITSRKPFLLAFEEGIAIYPDDGTNYPRLPLLGLRAIINNNLRLVIDGKRKHVSLMSPSW
jgi:hypothetical protein